MSFPFSFFENLNRISKPEYVPNEQDVLRARLNSTKSKRLYSKERNKEEKILKLYNNVLSLVCLMWEVKDQKGENGFIVLMQ
jgi:hypothetical protein